MKLKIILIIAALLLGMGGCARQEDPDTQAQTDFTGASTEPSTQQTEEPKTMAPDFTVYDAQGNAFKLSDFRGKPVVLNFWASWCGPCKSEMPEFDEAYKKYGDDIWFLMVNLTDGTQETVAGASAFIAGAGYSFPVYYDTSSEAATVYGIYSIPTTYFIDADGYAVAYGSGALSMENLERGIGMIAR